MILGRDDPSRPDQRWRCPHASKPLLRLLLLTLAGLVAPLPIAAQISTPSLIDMSIEDLMNIEITSASRKEQRAVDVAAAVFVITHDDIRRSGMTTVPDLLRLAPGVDVAQINSNKWAVSVRGFNDLYADKLLVLIDGRSVYNRLFSGVFWDAQDLMIDDIDRIEVIRGPGAAIWGANAVNGAINIVTRTAAESQGGLVRVEAGRAGVQGAVRYGGTVGAAGYRLFSQWTGRDESLIAPATPANDSSHSVTTGFRVDLTARPGALSLEGALTAGRAQSLLLNLNPETAARQPISTRPSDSQGGYLVGRFTKTRASGAALQIQSSVDIANRQEPVGDYFRHAFDVDTQYHTALAGRQDVVAGAGYRFVGEGFAGRDGFSLTPAIDESSLLTAFVQDEIALLGRRLAVTVGSQVQYDSFSGTGVQPTVRAIWKGLPRQRLWAGVSRALRTPSLYERGIRIELLPVPTDSGLPLDGVALGNPAIKAQTFVDTEAGYRLEIGTTGSIDVTGFVGHYHRLQTQELAAPIVQLAPSPHLLLISQLGDQLEATTRGMEVTAHWTPTPSWRFDGSYALFRLVPLLSASSQDPAAATEDGSAPRLQWQLRSTFSPSPQTTVSAAIFHVGPLAGFQVPAYSRLDVNLEWRLNPRLSAMVIGQNLLDATHSEFSGADSLMLATRLPRNVGLRLRWAF